MIDQRYLLLSKSSDPTDAAKKPNPIPYEIVLKDRINIKVGKTKARQEAKNDAIVNFPLMAVVVISIEDPIVNIPMSNDITGITVYGIIRFKIAMPQRPCASHSATDDWRRE